MNYFDFQAIGVYGQSGTSSTLKMRDYKDATDLVEVEREREAVWKQQYEDLLRLSVNVYRDFLTDGRTSASGWTAKVRNTRTQTHRGTRHSVTVSPLPSGSGWLRGWSHATTVRVRWDHCLTA